MNPFKRRVNNATAIAFSGFFMREASWNSVRQHFRRFYCLDHLRNIPSLTLEQYCNAVAELITKTQGPHVFVAHSFGGFLALATAAISKEKPKEIILLSGLGYKAGVTALETYMATLQTKSWNYSRFDPVSGAVRLVAPTLFKEKICHPDGVLEASALANEEPLGLIVESPKIALGVPTERLCYVIPLDDQFTPPLVQQKIAEELKAEVQYCHGSHVAPLTHPNWIERNLKKMNPFFYPVSLPTKCRLAILDLGPVRAATDPKSLLPDYGNHEKLNESNFDFIGGRLCAHSALESVGCIPAPKVGVATDGGPLWPQGFTGSISHTEAFAIAVAARKSEVNSIGIDIEGNLDSVRALEIENLIMTHGEHENLPLDITDRTLQITKIFSLKESTYKAVSVLAGKKIDFLEAEVIFDQENSDRVEILVPCLNIKLEGVCLKFLPNHIVTIVWFQGDYP